MEIDNRPGRWASPLLHLVALTAFAAAAWWCVASGRFDNSPCPSCVGHGELKRDCLCYHAGD